MAIETGECGSTSEVRNLLAFSGINIDTLAACEGVEADLTDRLERLASNAQGVLQEKLTEMEAALAERRGRTARTAEKTRARVKARRTATKEAASTALRASFLGGIGLQLTSYGHSILGEVDNFVSGQIEQVSRLSQASEQRRIAGRGCHWRKSVGWMAGSGGMGPLRWCWKGMPRRPLGRAGGIHVLSSREIPI